LRTSPEEKERETTMQVTNGSKEGDPFGLEGGCCKLRKSPTSKSIGERKLYIYIYIYK